MKSLKKMREEEKKRLSLRLPLTVFRAVNQFALDQDRPLTWVIIDILVISLKQKGYLEKGDNDE